LSFQNQEHFEGRSSRRSESTKSTENRAIGSEALRKAIQRNREKQAKREKQDEANGGSRLPLPSNSARNRRRDIDLEKMLRSERQGERKSVGRADDVEFLPVRKKIRRSGPAMKYSVEKRASKRQLVPKMNNIKKYLVFFALVGLLGRLVFSRGGVIDYYQKEREFQKLALYYQSLLKENQEFHKEIKEFESNPSLQKQVLRDQMNLIGKDEFLILFRQAPATTSI